MIVPFPRILALVAAVGPMLLLACNPESCSNPECRSWSNRLAVGVVPWSGSDAGGPGDGGATEREFRIVFAKSNGDSDEYDSAATNPSPICIHRPTGMIWTSCTGDPTFEWVDVTVAPYEGEEATLRVELAEHNYCGHDIAYVVATLHDDGPPTFTEVLYVSPCENGSL